MFNIFIFYEFCYKYKIKMWLKILSNFRFSLLLRDIYVLTKYNYLMIVIVIICDIELFIFSKNQFEKNVLSRQLNHKFMDIYFTYYKIYYLKNKFIYVQNNYKKFL
jgi:hypothetical protein